MLLTRFTLKSWRKVNSEIENQVAKLSAAVGYSIDDMPLTFRINTDDLTWNEDISEYIGKKLLPALTTAIDFSIEAHNHVYEVKQESVKLIED